MMRVIEAGVHGDRRSRRLRGASSRGLDEQWSLGVMRPSERSGTMAYAACLWGLNPVSCRKG